MEEPEFEAIRPRPKTPISAETLKRIDQYYADGLTKWKERYRDRLKEHRSNQEHFNITVTQLFESYENGHHDALPFLDKLIACQPSKKCWQIFCPACRAERQEDVATKTLEAFHDQDASDIKFMTLLIKIEKDALLLPDLLRTFRLKLQNKLRNNKVRLGKTLSPLKMIGAFEIDLKNLATQWDASLNTRDLIKKLGFDPKHKPSQYLLHLHAVVGPLDDARKDTLETLIENLLGQELLSHQLEFRSLHGDKTKEYNLSYLSHYMYKARLQFADNIFGNNLMQKRTKYHTPFKGRPLIDYLKVIDEMQNFKGLKFDYGI